MEKDSPFLLMRSFRFLILSGIVWQSRVDQVYFNFLCGILNDNATPKFTRKVTDECWHSDVTQNHCFNLIESSTLYRGNVCEINLDFYNLKYIYR